MHEVKEGQGQVEHEEGTGAERNSGIISGAELLQFDADKTGTGQQRQSHPARAGGCCVATDGIDGAYHEKAGSDQDDGIYRTAFAVQQQLVFVEQLDVVRSREGIGQKENAEHQQFGKDEYPDREIPRQVLLVRRCRGIVHGCAPVRRCPPSPGSVRRP